MKVTTYDIKKGKTVTIGEIVGEQFIKKVNRDKHYLYVAGGYAIQKDAIEKMKDEVKEIVFIENKKKRLVISMNHFLIKSRQWTGGHGTQLVISEKYLTEQEKVVR